MNPYMNKDEQEIPRKMPRADSPQLLDCNTKSNSSEEKLYFDYNATTPLEPSVIQVINQALQTGWGNPSSLYASGLLAKSMINKARCRVAEMLNASPNDVIFTSGGTESNNMVFHSVIEYFNSFQSKQNRRSNKTRPVKPHIITSNVEHDSVIRIAQDMEARNLIELTVCEVNPTTGMLPANVACAIARDNTVLISLMMANNETGIIQEIGSIATQLDGINKLRQVKNLPKILLHTDAAQAIGKIEVDVEKLGVDYLTVVGHKFYGPRIGALWAKDLQSDNVILSPMLFGGGQEQGYRPGTENTPMVSGLGEAARLVKQNLTRYKEHMQTVRDYFEDRLLHLMNDTVRFNGRYSESTRLPNTSNVSFVGERREGYRVLTHCQRIQASVGAACHSNRATKPSRILMASGVHENIARNAIRFSFGRETKLTDINVLIEELKTTLSSLSVGNLS